MEHPKGRVLGQPSDLSLQLAPAALQAGPYSPTLRGKLSEPAKQEGSEIKELISVSRHKLHVFRGTGSGPRLSRGRDVWVWKSDPEPSRSVPSAWICSAGSPRGPSPSRPLHYSGTCSRHHFSKGPDLGPPGWRPGAGLSQSVRRPRRAPRRAPRSRFALRAPSRPSPLCAVRGRRGARGRGGAEPRLPGFPRGGGRADGGRARARSTDRAVGSDGASAGGERRQLAPHPPHPGRDSAPTTAAARHSRGPGTKPLDAAPRSRLAPEMSQFRGAWFLTLFVLLVLLPPPGHGNEGSVIGSCYCHTAIRSGSPTTAEFLAHLRKHLRAYDRCNSYIRFQLHSRSVCGGTKDSWVQQLMSCFDRKECGYAKSGSVTPQKHLRPPSTQVPEPTQRAPLDMGSPAQTYLPPASQSTVQPTLPAGAPSLDKKLTHANEIAASTEGHGLGAGPEAGERQKQLEEKVGPSAGTSAMVPVLSLLTIVFLLTIVLLYVLCKRRREQLLQHSPDLQLHYTPMASDSNA